ncbi:MAG: septation regulator SpoVG [Bacillota bacterium]
MQITDVKIRKVLSEGKMKAIVSVTFDNAFVVHDIKVVEGKTGLFVAMPSRRVPNGDFRDVAHPITPDARKQLEEAVLTAYKAYNNTPEQ